MRRFPIGANHACEQPCRIIVYDTETWQDECPTDLDRVLHKLRLGVARLWVRRGIQWRCKSTLRFLRGESFIRYVLDSSSKRETTWIYAHNQCFDATQIGLWGELDFGTFRLDEPGGYYVDPRTKQTRKAADWHGRLAVDALPFIVETSSDHGKQRWVDTLNYIPAALQSIGDWVGIKKLGMPSESAGDDDWFTYCERDVDILEACVFKLLNLWIGRRLGNWQPTIAGLSFSCFRHLEPYSGIVGHGDEENSVEVCQAAFERNEPQPLSAYDCSRIERRAYYGGRTFVGYVGDCGGPSVQPDGDNLFADRQGRRFIKGPVTAFDCNGLYPYVLKVQPFPIELMDRQINPPLEWALDTIQRYLCIADVVLNTAFKEYPVKLDNRTLYCVGRFPTTLAGPELRAAAASGHIKQINTLLVYHSGQPFQNFVQYWWAWRLEAKKSGDDLSAKLCKSMLNGITGKLAQRRPKWERVYDIVPPVRWGGFVARKEGEFSYSKYRAVAGAVQKEGERIDCQHTCTFIAAFITAYGRTYLQDIRDKLPMRSCVYQDTDSLFLLPDGAEALRQMGLVDPNELGKFKEVGTFDEVQIYGAKNYVREGIPVIAGLRRNARETGPREWEQTVFERAAGVISREPDGMVASWTTRFVPDVRRPGYNVGADGWTYPLRIG